jgi:hypothetical protein
MPATTEKIREKEKAIIQPAVCGDSSHSIHCHLNKLAMTKEKILMSAAFILAAVSAFAQGNGIGGITDATNMVTSYFDPGTKLIYAIGAVVGLIGGIKVYNKFSSGDPDTSKTAASWFGACIFLIVAATILRSFFL